MKKNIWMVLAAASLMTACDYNEKYFEGFDETDQSNVQKYTVEYTEKTFKETESAKDVIIPWLTQKYYTWHIVIMFIRNVPHIRQMVKYSHGLSHRNSRQKWEMYSLLTSVSEIIRGML